MVQNTTGLSRDLIIHPGETLKEVLFDREMNQKELASRIGMSEKHVSEIITYKKSISNEVAKRLEYVLEIPASFWMNLQMNYDREIIEYEEINKILDDEIAALKPLKAIILFLKSMKIISDTSCKAQMVVDLRNFLRVSRLTDIPSVVCNAAFRAQPASTNEYVLFAWMALCEKITENINTAERFDAKKLKDSLIKIKNIMFEPVGEIPGKLEKLFADCGVSFAIVQNFRGAPVQGFIKRSELTGKTILCMTIRGAYADRFWFTLFHEIAHLLNGDIKQKFVDFNDTISEIEEKANEFAAKTLLNSRKYNQFVDKNDFSKEAIFRFAESQGVKPFVVVGRLSRDRHLLYSELPELRERYMWQ